MLAGVAATSRDRLCLIVPFLIIRRRQQPPRRCGPCRAWQAAQSSTPSLQFQAKPPPSAHEPTCRLCCQNGRSSLCKPRRRLGHCARRRSPGPAVSPPAVAAARAAAAAPTPGSYRRTRHRSCKLGEWNSHTFLTLPAPAGATMA